MQVSVLRVYDEQFNNIVLYALKGPIGILANEEGGFNIVNYKVDNNLTGRVTIISSHMLILDFKDGDLIDFTVILGAGLEDNYGEGDLNEGSDYLC